jgi:hypothetical protein
VPPGEQRCVRGYRQPYFGEGNAKHYYEGDEKQHQQPQGGNTCDQSPARRGSQARQFSPYSVNTTGLEPCQESQTLSSRAIGRSAPRMMFGSVTRIILPESICTR